MHEGGARGHGGGLKAARRFRVGENLKLRDEDAGATPLRAEAGKDTLSRHAIKQAEREATAGLTAQIARCQEMLYARRKE